MSQSIMPHRVDNLTSEGIPSLETLYREQFHRVYRMVARLLGPYADRADVDDITQQVFIAAHRALPHFRGDCQLSTWLFGIASNIVVDFFRSQRRRRQLLDAIEPPARVDANPDPEQALEQREQLRHAWHCLMQLKPKKRIVYLLFEVEGIGGAQIAEILDIPEATVWTRLHQARRDLLRATQRRHRGEPS